MYASNLCMHLKRNRIILIITSNLLVTMSTFLSIKKSLSEIFVYPLHNRNKNDKNTCITFTYTRRFVSDLLKDI